MPKPDKTRRVVSIRTVLLSVLGLAVAGSLLLYVPVWREDAERRRNRAAALGLIGVGETLERAESKLIEAGFRLVYDEAIDQTGTGERLTQLVIVGDTRPNAFETIEYVTQTRWMPFTRSESSYLAITADPDGVITDID